MQNTNYFRQSNEIRSITSSNEIQTVFVRFSFSFVIVAMEELDGDTVRLSSRGRYAERDIVQVR